MTEEGHGPEIVAGLHESRAAYEAGDRDRSLAIVDELRRQYGDDQVDAVVGALRFGFITLDNSGED